VTVHYVGVAFRSGKEFDLMPRAMGFAALALLTVIPLLVKRLRLA
jgi:hypothetical protein